MLDVYPFCSLGLVYLQLSPRRVNILCREVTTWPERKVDRVKLRKQQSSLSGTWRWGWMERNICFLNWEGRLTVLYSGEGSKGCPTHSSLMVIQDRVMKLEGGEQELVSSCHRLKCKFMVFMSFVPYKYKIYDKQSFIPGFSCSCDSRTRKYTVYLLQLIIVVNVWTADSNWPWEVSSPLKPYV